MAKVEILSASPCILGEGPRWNAAEHELTWVDIESGRWYLSDGCSSETTFAVMGPQVTFAEPIDGLPGHAVLGLPHGIALGCRSSSTAKVLAEMPDPQADVRMNDSGVDPKGRVFAGSMHSTAERALGKLYRLANGAMTPVHAGLTVSNGIGWSPDGRTLYLIDSFPGRLVSFDYDPDTGEVFEPRSAIALAGDGIPDGLAVDAEGCVWVAFWGGSEVRRYRPDGTLSQVIGLPVSQPTSLTFGGPDLDLMYITSARLGLSPSDLAREPAGAVLVVDPGCQGLASKSVSIRNIAPNLHGCECGQMPIDPR